MSAPDHLDDLKRRFKTTGVWAVSWRLTQFMRPYWTTVAAAWAVQALALGMMFIPADIIGRACADIGNHDFSRLWIFAIIIVANEIVRFGITLGQAQLQIRVTGHAEWDLQVKLYDALQRMSLSWHDRESTGQLISRMITDMRFVGGFYRMVVFQMTEIVLVFSIGTVYLFVKQPLLALVALSPLPVVAIVIVKFARMVRMRFYDVRQQHGVVTTALSENIGGVQVVRGFAREREQTEAFERESRRLIDSEMSAARIYTFSDPALSLVVNVGFALTFFVAAGLVANAAGTADAKDIFAACVAFFFALRFIAQRLYALAGGIGMTLRAVASADRIFEMLDQAPDISDRKDSAPLAAGPGRVVFEHVSFGYDPAHPVLHDIDLAVEPGQMVAFVGRTGAGKTSLVSLLPRFYEPTSGRILIDGQDVRDVTLDSLRADIGLVFQDAFLFSRSVAENIAYADPKADMERVVRSAEAAKAHEFIRELPEGYDTIVGERGTTLSGGQRQRLTIARALMKDPRILILDDSTSSVDPTTEREIHEAMMHVAKYRTTFVIAHRLSTVRRADLIVVLEGGRIVERGKHDELLRRDGFYRKLCEMQFDASGGPVIVDDTQNGGEPPKPASQT